MASFHCAFFGENRGGSRAAFTFSLESIKEFQIITNGFDVEWGNFSGGVINAVTKGGTNEFHGSAFYFARDEALTGTDFLGGDAVAFQSKQFGFQLSGPIARDKAHFFVSLDGQDKDEPTFAIVPEKWCSSCDPDLAEDFIQQFGRILESQYGVPAAEFAANIGTLPKTEDEIAFFGRLDWALDDRNTLTVSNNYTDFSQINDRISTSEAATHGAIFDDKSNAFVAELTSVLGDEAKGYNTFRFNWTDQDRPRDGNNLLPEVDVNPRFVPTGETEEVDLPAGDVEYFGDGIVFRNRLEESKVQLIDNLTWALGETGAHQIKVGTNNLFTSITNLFWLLGNGDFSFSDLEAFENKVADQGYARFVTESGESPFAEYNVSEYGFYGQDEWQVNDNVLFTFGLRYDVDVYNDKALPSQLFIDGFSQFGLANETVPEDNNNWSPRFALTIDPRGDGKGVFRTGFGLFYGNVPFVLHGNVMQTTPELRRLSCSNRRGEVPELDYDFFRQAPDGSNNPLVCAGAGFTGTPEFAIWKENFENPETWKFNVGYEQVTDSGWRFSGDILYSKTSNNFNVININLNGCDFSTVAGSDGIDCEPEFRTAVDNRPVSGR